MLVTEFDFELPDSLIATRPAHPKESAKLLCVEGNDYKDNKISDLPQLLKRGDLLVFNNTKVIPAYFNAVIGSKAVTINLHKKLTSASYLAFIKPAKKASIGDVINIADNFYGKIINKDAGEITIEFNVNGKELEHSIEQYGKMPLPPYILSKRLLTESDTNDYQTIFAKKKGAVAAPTASLHFTHDLLEKLHKQNINKAFVTLHVGAGTFLPVKTQSILEHKMHSEYGEISQETAALINNTKKQGGRIIAVGTTTLRILETASSNVGAISAFKGDTDIFITPGYDFKLVDMLLTNFHLPKSTLFMLVCAFSGIDRMKQAYVHAVERGYRFYSYGDACLLS